MRHKKNLARALARKDFMESPGFRTPQPDEAVLEKRQAKREQLADELGNLRSLSPTYAAAWARLAEFLGIIAIGFAVMANYPGFRSAAEVSRYAVLITIAAAIFAATSEIGKGYKLFNLLNPKGMLSKVVAAWLGTFSALLILVLFSKAGESFSRIFIASWFVSGAIGMIAMRSAIGAVLRQLNRDGQFNRRTLLVGGGHDAEAVIKVLEGSPDAGVSIVGVFDDRFGERSPEEYGETTKLGNVEEMVDFVRKAKIDTVIVTLPVSAEKRLNDILEKLWILPVDIRLSAHAQKVRYRPHAYSYLGNLPCLDVYDRPLGDWGEVLKSIEDKVIATIAFVLLLPVFLLTALAVRVDSKGPVLFKQKRYGFNNELIEVYKFRSMYTEMSDAKADKLVTKGDPRVTRVGRFIRKTSLDELPQLINVLKGDLSLVGPRPHATAAKAAGSLYEKVVDGYFGRHKVKPGMTGWAQVNGWRGETDTEEKIHRRVECDLYYIENWSLTFDLYILARTPFALLKTEQAY